MPRKLLYFAFKNVLWAQEYQSPALYLFETLFLQFSNLKFIIWLEQGLLCLHYLLCFRKRPVKLSIHHTHLLLKPLQESNNSSRSSHTSCQSSTWQLPEAPQFFPVDLGFCTCPRLLALYAHLSFSASLFHLVLRIEYSAPYMSKNTEWGTHQLSCSEH